MPTAYLAEVSIDGGSYTVLAASETTGQDRKVHTLTGLAPGVHTALVRVTPLDASGPPVVSAPLEFTVPDGDALAGTSTGTSDASGSLDTAITMSGTSTGTSTLSADLSTGQAPIELSGTSTGTSDATADLTTGAGSTTVSDDFERANGGLGSNWTTAPGFNAPLIVNNELSASVPNAGAYYSGRIFTADQYVEFTAGASTTLNSTGGGLRVRQSTSVNTFYGAGKFDDGEGTEYWELYKYVAGSRTVLGSWTGGDSLSRLEAVGNSLVLKTRPTSGSSWSMRISTTDSSIASGQPGLSSDYCYGDNFTAGDL